MNIYRHELEKLELVTCARKLQMVAQQKSISDVEHRKMPSDKRIGYSPEKTL